VQQVTQLRGINDGGHCGHDVLSAKRPRDLDTARGMIADIVYIPLGVKATPEYIYPPGYLTYP